MKKANAMLGLGLLMGFMASGSSRGKGSLNRQPDIESLKGLSKKQKISKLVQMLKKYNAAYRSGTPLIDDISYDELKERLRALDAKNKWLLSVEPEPKAGRQKVFHNPPMLSTKKAYTDIKIREYLNRIVSAAKKLGIQNPEVLITPKLDGIAIDWSDGRLSTRGDGEYGYDISKLVDLGLVFIPNSLMDNEFRGELVVSRPYFNRHLASDRSQPRSFVSGLALSKTIAGEKLRALELGAVHAVSFASFTEDQRKTYPLTAENIDLIVATLAEIHADIINSVPYDCDGIVFSVVDPELHQQLGRKGDYWLSMIAYKMRGEKQITKVKNIDWSMSRYGILTPVIEFEPVWFDQVTYKDGTKTKGVCMTRASGFNLSLCQRRGYGLGAEIVVLLSGEVIPYISEVVKPSLDIEFPVACPYCETPTVMKGPALACPNPMCRGALSKGIQLFTSEMDMKGFGKATILKLVDKGFNRVSKVLNMSLKDFRSVVGPKTAKKLFHSVQKTFATRVPKATLIRALGIEKIGETKSDDLVRSIPNLDIRRMNEIQRQELLKMKGIGGKTADTIKESLKKMWPQIEQIVGHDFDLIEPQLQTPVRQNAKRFLFTGRLQFGRKEIERYTRETGNIVLANFDEGKPDFIVAGSSPGEYRIKKAKRQKIPIITEQQFFSKVK